MFRSMLSKVSELITSVNTVGSTLAPVAPPAVSAPNQYHPDPFVKTELLVVWGLCCPSLGVPAVGSTSGGLFIYDDRQHEEWGTGPVNARLPLPLCPLIRFGSTRLLV